MTQVFSSDLLNTLFERGFIVNLTAATALDEAAHQPIGAYIGFDCTAPSLHVGSLVQLQVLRWLQRLGHTPVCLLGYATTQVGDPTGKDKARPMLSDDVIHTNTIGIRKTVSRIVPGVIFVKNDRWFNSMWSFVHVLRKFGQHFSVNRMLTLDVFSRRLENEQNLSFLEFCYPIMQAVDFLELHQSREKVVLQVGGSDQWGNIVGGIDLIRRVTGNETFGLTTPLLVNSAGEKMGKTAGGQTIWLDPDMTSPFDFWQFWRNVEDDRVEPFLKLFTDLDLETITNVMSDINHAKKVLATAVTALVHGAAEAKVVLAQAEEIFENGNLDSIPSVRVPFRDGKTYADVLVDLGMARSKGDADRLAAQNGVRLDSAPISDVRAVIPEGVFVLGVGKKKMVRIAYVRL